MQRDIFLGKFPFCLNFYCCCQQWLWWAIPNSHNRKLGYDLMQQVIQTVINMHLYKLCKMPHYHTGLKGGFKTRPYLDCQFWVSFVALWRMQVEVFLLDYRTARRGEESRLKTRLLTVHKEKWNTPTTCLFLSQTVSNKAVYSHNHPSLLIRSDVGPITAKNIASNTGNT